MATDYVPRNEPQLAVWLSNMGKKLSTHGPALGLTAEEINAAVTGCNDTSAKITEIEQKKNDLHHLVAIKDEVRDASLSSLRGLVTRMKAHPGYTEAIGQDLGVIAVTTSADLINNKTTLKADVLPGRVRISFTKKGFTGVNIYSRLEGTAKWIFLARDTNSPYEDNRPLANDQPEKREYMAMGVVGDDEVGQPSDILSVLFGG
jgi:hypothetical protein